MASSDRIVSLSLSVREEEQPADPEFSRWTVRLASGEEEAWRDFFDRYHGRLTGFVRAAWMGDQGSVDDLVQDTMIRAVRYMRRFEQEEVLWCWLVRLARSSIADKGKIQKRRWTFLSRFRDWEGHRALHGSELPGDNELIAAAMEALDDTARLILQRKYADGQSVQSIAEEMGLTQKAAESRLSRARASLRRQIRKQKQS